MHTVSAVSACHVNKCEKVLVSSLASQLSKTILVLSTQRPLGKTILPSVPASDPRASFECISAACSCITTPQLHCSRPSPLPYYH